MNRYKNWTLPLLLLMPCAVALATPVAVRAPIEKFEFTEVLNLKSKAQIGRTKITTWADTLQQEANAAAVQADAKSVAGESRTVVVKQQAKAGR